MTASMSDATLARMEIRRKVSSGVTFEQYRVICLEAHFPGCTYDQMGKIVSEEWPGSLMETQLRSCIRWSHVCR